MIARSITIVAPIVNEWAAPMPIVVMLAFSFIGIAVSFTFPSEESWDVEKHYFHLNEEGNIAQQAILDEKGHVQQLEDSDITEIDLS